MRLKKKVRKSIEAIFVLTISSLWAFAQPPQNIKQDAKNASCSNIVALAGNVNVDCSSLTPAQQKLIESIPALLHKILADQLDPKAVMDKLNEIGKDVKKLGRGIYSGYDFNGAKREQRPGVMGVTGGEEVTVFQNMLKLQSEHRWDDLLDITENQIKKTPDWLTPYLFSGIANANLGKRSAAIDRLKFVQEEAAGNPDYADAERILRQLQQ
jgi:hypothetical protein